MFRFEMTVKVPDGLSCPRHNNANSGLFKLFSIKWLYTKLHNMHKLVRGPVLLQYMYCTNYPFSKALNPGVSPAYQKEEQVCVTVCEYWWCKHVWICTGEQVQAWRGGKHA